MKKPEQRYNTRPHQPEGTALAGYFGAGITDTEAEEPGEERVPVRTDAGDVVRLDLEDLRAVVDAMLDGETARAAMRRRIREKQGMWGL